MQELAQCLVHGGRAGHPGLGRGICGGSGRRTALAPEVSLQGLWLFLPGGGAWKEVSRVTALNRSGLSLQEFMPSHRHLVPGSHLPHFPPVMSPEIPKCWEPGQMAWSSPVMMGLGAPWLLSEPQAWQSYPGSRSLNTGLPLCHWGQGAEGVIAAVSRQ